MSDTSAPLDLYTVTDVMDRHPHNTGMEVCGVIHSIAGPGHAPLTAEQYAEAAVRLRAIEAPLTP